MTKNIELVLTGRQRDEAGEESVTESRFDAEYYEKNDGFYILYEEIPENSGASVKSRIKYRNSVLELTKRGAVNTRMVFEAGTRQRADYATPYGVLEMDVFTKALNASLQCNEIVIKIEYTLSYGGRPLSDCILTISIFSKTG